MSRYTTSGCKEGLKNWPSLKVISYVENLRTVSMPRRRTRPLWERRGTGSYSGLRTIPFGWNLLREKKKREGQRLLGALDFTLEEIAKKSDLSE
jgi:hypothetical protein